MLTKKQVEKRLKDGRGDLLKHGKDYYPFYDSRDTKLFSNRPQIMGHKTGRIHHGGSQLEGDVLLVLDWQKNVIDIREQAVLQQAQTDAIYRELGFPGSPSHIPYTIDVVYTYLHEGRERYKPLSVKYAKDFENIKTARNFEVKRVYFEQMRERYSAWDAWSVVTDRDIPPVYLTNINVLHNYYDLTEYGIDHDLLAYVQRPLTAAVLESQNVPLKQVTREMDEKVGSNSPISLQIAYHLIATGKWQVDLCSGPISETPLIVHAVADDLVGVGAP